MIGLRDFCHYLLAASLGGGGVVAVQQAAAPKPATVEKSVTVRSAKRPTVKKSLTVARPAPVAIADCPVPALPALPAPDIGPFFDALPPMAGRAQPFPMPGAPYLPGPWGGGGAPPPFAAPPDIPAVPEPAGWVMLLAGFGLVGMGLRRSDRRRRDNRRIMQ